MNCLTEIVENENYLITLFFPLRLHFTSLLLLNQQNCRIWASQQSNCTNEFLSNSLIVNFWFTIHCHGNIDPFVSAEETVTKFSRYKTFHFSQIRAENK